MAFLANLRDKFEPSRRGDGRNVAGLERLRGVAVLLVSAVRIQLVVFPAEVRLHESLPTRRRCAVFDSIAVVGCLRMPCLSATVPRP